MLFPKFISEQEIFILEAPAKGGQMNQKQHGRNMVPAGWQQVQSQPFEASSQAELQRPVNRSYKDTLFRMLFQEKEALLSLYNAVGQTDYKDASQLEIVTLENAIYMNMKNDLAFLINLELNLYEHQSTWNPNMPLRDLFYVAKEYEQLIRKETLYSSRLVKLPVPRFLVFCNGRMPDQAEKIILKLSDSFEKRTGEPELELKVTVLNINAGCNETLMNACRLLKEYSLYVARVRSYASQMDMNTAVNRAVEECISEGILEDFLLKSRAEVVAMSIFEYDEERERELIKKAEFESGKEEGLKLGKAQGIELGKAQGIELGKAQGIELGKIQGIAALIQAFQDLGASREAALLSLKKQFSLSEEEAERQLEQLWPVTETQQ